MDVGVWGGNYEGRANTDFGLVCGKYVLLCSWLNMDGSSKKPTQIAPYPEPIKKVLNARSDRAFVKAEARALTKLTGDSEMILVVPDLHIHLFRCSRYDNFKYNANFAAPAEEANIVSLEGELDELLTLGDSHAAIMVQIGDLFELWEVQAHLMNDYLQLDRLRAGLVNEVRDPLGPVLRQPWEKMWRDRKIIPRDDFELGIDRFDHLKREPESYGLRRGVSERDIHTLGVAIESSDACKRAIMDKYPLVFGGSRYGPRMRFKWIQGNHDNMLPNNLYVKKNEGPGIKGTAETRPELIIRYGQESSVWMEHGHKYDIYNNDQVFDQPGKGYDLTRGYTTGAVIGEEGVHEGSVSRWAGDVIYPMRPDQLQRAEQIFKENAQVRLVIMGHTHAATLFDWDQFLECRTQEEQQEQQREEQLDMAIRLSRPG